MRNRQSCPNEFEPFPEVNVISSQTHGRGLGQGQGQGCGHGRGRNSWYYGAHGSNSSTSKKKKASLHHQKLSNTEVKQEHRKCIQDKPPKNHETNCYKCDMKGHWACTCHMHKHLVDLYRLSLKVKGKAIEMNFIDGDGFNRIYYDIDFFGDPKN